MENRLTPEEQELITNTEWLFMKSAITKKVVQMFAEAAEGFVSTSKALPLSLISIPPKISKGENYNGLPYVMLDYPRNFKKEKVFAIRSFFWWGTFIVRRYTYPEVIFKTLLLL
jgi:hypothetical protein